MTLLNFQLICSLIYKVYDQILLKSNFYNKKEFRLSAGTLIVNLFYVLCKKIVIFCINNKQIYMKNIRISVKLILALEYFRIYESAPCLFYRIQCYFQIYVIVSY